MVDQVRKKSTCIMTVCCLPHRWIPTRRTGGVTGGFFRSLHSHRWIPTRTGPRSSEERERKCSRGQLFLLFLPPSAKLMHRNGLIARTSAKWAVSATLRAPPAAIAAIVYGPNKDIFETMTGELLANNPREKTAMITLAATRRQERPTHHPRAARGQPRGVGLQQHGCAVLPSRSRHSPELRIARPPTPWRNGARVSRLSVD